MLNPTEMVPLLLGVVILVGGKKLPELGSGLGKGISEFKKAITGGSDEEKKLPKEGEQKTEEVKPGEPPR
jgi:sec-independent protein translocase protein TatA